MKNSKGQGVPSQSDFIDQSAKKVGFHKPKKQRGLRVVYAYYTDHGMNTSTCVVKLVDFKGKWYANAFSSDSSAETAIGEAIESNGGGNKVTILHAPPFDFKICDLK